MGGDVEPPVYARLVGLPIFDPQGDQVAKVRDVVVALRSEANQPRVLGLVAEVFGRRRIFVPMTRVTYIDAGQVSITGLLNMRRFEQRIAEVCERVRPHLLHAHSPVLNVLPALRVARRLGLPVVYEVRAFWEDAAVDHGTTTDESIFFAASASLTSRSDWL